MPKDPMLDFMVRGLTAQRAVDTAIQEGETKMRATRCLADRQEADRKHAELAGLCAKCGRAFTSKSQYRYAAGLKANICRDARACKAQGSEG